MKMAEIHLERDLKTLIMVWAGILFSAYAIGNMGVQRPILLMGVIAVFLLAGLISLSPVVTALMIFAMVMVHMNRIIPIPVIGVAPNYTLSEWFLLGIFSLLFLDQLIRRNPLAWRIPLMLPLVLWAAAIFLSGPHKGLFVAFRGRLVTVLSEGAPILAYLAVFWLLRTGDQVRKVISGMIFLGAGIAVWGMIQYFNGYYSQLTPGGIPRLGLPVQNHIGFNGSIGVCSFISLILPLALQRLIDTKRIQVKALYLFLSGIFCVTAFLTFARGGWLGILAGFLIFFFQSERGRKGRILLFIVFILFAFYCTGTLGLIQERLVGETVQEFAGGIEDSGRHLLMKTALKAFLTHPLTGIGIGNFAAFNYQFGYFYLPLEKQYCDAHNYFLQVLAESGLLGLAGVVAVLFLFFSRIRNAVRTGRRNTPGKQMVQALSIGLISFLVTNLTNYNVGTNAMRLLIGFYMGLMMVIVMDHESEIESDG